MGGLPPDFNRLPFTDDGIRFDGFFGCIQSGILLILLYLLNLYYSILVRPTQVSELDL